MYFQSLELHAEQVAWGWRFTPLKINHRAFTTCCWLLQLDCDVYTVENRDYCKPTDKWPYGVCTLKTLSQDTPGWWSQNPSE